MKQSRKKTTLAAMGLCAALMLTGCGKSDAAKYEDAQKLVREGAYDEAITAFTEIDGYEDSSKYLMYIKAIQMAENGQRDLAVSTLTTLGDFADSKMLAIYYQAQEDEAKQEYESADALYRTIATFKDSAERIAAIPDLILDRDFANSKIQVEWDGDCSEMIALLEETYSADENKMKQQIYDYAQERLECKGYDTAYELFEALSWCKYNDSAVRMKDVVYAYAQDEMSQGEYQTALDTLSSLTDYPAAEEAISECRYQLAMQAEADGRYARAYAEYTDLGEYKDCADKAARFENEYAAASALLAGGEYDNAKSAFEALKDYADAEKMAKESVYQKGEKLLADKDYDGAIAAYQAAGNYSDAATKAKEAQYQKGESLFATGDYDGAIAAYQAAGNYSDAVTKAKEAQYQKGESLLADHNERAAVQTFEAIAGYRDALKRSYQIRYRDLSEGKIAAGINHTIGVKSDGTLVAAGSNKSEYGLTGEETGQCQISNWNNIVSVAAGGCYTVGLKADGTVIARGYNYAGKCNVSGWRNIVAIAAGEHHTVGLKSDGTVVATGNNFRNQCDVSNWTNIVAIAAGPDHTVGLKSDGTVVAAGNAPLENSYSEQCKVGDWTNIVAIAAGGGHTVGVKSDGTVVAAGYNRDDECDVSGWRDIVVVAAGRYHTVGLKSDGTVVATGDNGDGQCDVSDWTDIVSVAAGYDWTVGLKSDGTVVATGDNYRNQCDVGGWVDIGGTMSVELKISAEEAAQTGLYNEYEVTGFGPFKVKIELNGNGRIVSASVLEHHETPGLGADLIADQSVFDALVGQNIETAQIDVKSGVTLTSNAINDALSQAKEDWMKENGKEQTETTVDVGQTAYTNEYEVTGFAPFKVKIELDEDGRIVSASVLEHHETPGLGADLIADQSVFDALVGQNIETAQIDVKSGVTLTSNAINDALSQAKEDWMKENGKEQTETTVDVGQTAYTNEYEVTGFAPFKVKIELDEDGRIVSASVLEHHETPGLGADLIADQSVFDALVGQNIETAQIDVKSGVTLTSNAINDALKQAAQDFKK